MIADRNLSQNFKLSEFLRSQTATRNGIDMTPSDEIIANLERLCVTVLEPVRAYLKMPMIVSSGYRPPMLNRLVGGAPTSAHVYGRAADIVFPDRSPRSIVDSLKSWTEVPIFDQIIEEFGEWVHFGIAVNGTPARGQWLKAASTPNGTAYSFI